MLSLQHFDTKLRQDLDIQETIKNCLAEYFFPDTKMALGMVYDKGTIPADLRSYKGKNLQFSSGDRMYFADMPVGEQLYSIPSDRTAYGNLPFTPCESFREVSARILVVDDATGANGDVMPPDAAKNLVGDCFGKIDRDLAEDITGSPDTPFQYRLGIKPQKDCPVHRIAKGTLAPASLNRLSHVETDRSEPEGMRVKIGYDLILPTSSFKGRKGEDAIQPGAYTLTLGIGVKTLAKYGSHSLGTQILVNYPRGVIEDILPILREQAKELAAIQSDLRQLAQYYVKKYEQRQSGQETTEEDFAELGHFSAALDSAFGTAETPNQQQEDLLLYRILKADLQGHCQLLEHPKIVDALAKFVRRQWVDLATGRAIKFTAGLAQPSLDLKEDEVCVPILPDGEEIIVTRSPLLNSNGVIILKNRHLPSMMNQKGVVIINPDTAAKHLQADFDGDRLPFERASKYPTLTAEIKEALKPENRYPDVVKRKKVPYEGTFFEIAYAAKENKIGIIANQIQRAIALRWECDYLPEESKAAYVAGIAEHYRKILRKMPPHFQDRVKALANLPTDPSGEQIEQALNSVNKILYDVIGELSSELQVAADGPKSADRPNSDVLSYCKALSSYRPVGWQQDKKNQKAYQDRPMESSNCSPIDFTVQQTNGYYQASHLKSRALVTFRELFANVDFTKDQEEIAREIKDTYNELVAKANKLRELAESGEGPILTATSAKTGRSIEITNLLDFVPANQLLWTAKKLDIVLENNQDNTLPYHLIAIVTRDGQGNSCRRHLGAVSSEDAARYRLQAGNKLTGADISIAPGATDTQVKAAFKEVSDYLEFVRAHTPEEEKPAMAAALWYITHPRKDCTGQSSKALVAFSAFPEQIIQQLQHLCFKNLKVVGIHNKDINDRRKWCWRGEQVTAEIGAETDAENLNGKRIVRVEGKQLAPLGEESAALPIGTEFEAIITARPGKEVTATTRHDNTLKITQVRNYAYAETIWQGEEQPIEVGFLSSKSRRQPAIFLDGKPLGLLDSDSCQKLAKRKLLKAGTIFVTRLESSPSTAATLKIIPESVRYPWNKESSQQSAEAIASRLQEERTRYIAPILSNLLSLAGTSRYQGKHYETYLDEDCQTLYLNNKGENTPKLVAEYQNGIWQPLPLPLVEKDGKLTPLLEEQDMANFDEIKRKVEEKLCQQALSRQR